MRAATAFILALFSVGALAQQVLCPAVPSTGPREAQLCWINAGKDVNGNKLPATGPYSLIETRIQRAKVAKGATCSFDKVAQTVLVTPNVLARKYTQLTDGKHCWRNQHISKDADGKKLYGKWSKVGSKVIPAPKKTTARAVPQSAAEPEEAGMLKVY